MAVNCSTRIKKKWKISFSSAWFTFILLFFRICFFSIFPPPHNFFTCVLQSFFPLSVSLCILLGYFMLCCELGLSPHHGFCFLSQVHVAHIQIAPGWAKPPVCWVGQPALQTGLWRQDQQSAAGSRGAHQAAVKRGQLEPTGWSWVILRVDSKKRGLMTYSQVGSVFAMSFLWNWNSESFTYFNIPQIRSTCFVIKELEN